jgi:hypothetical protein
MCVKITAGGQGGNCAHQVCNPPQGLAMPNAAVSLQIAADSNSIRAHQWPCLAAALTVQQPCQASYSAPARRKHSCTSSRAGSSSAVLHHHNTSLAGYLEQFSMHSRMQSTKETQQQGNPHEVMLTWERTAPRANACSVPQLEKLHVRRLPGVTAGAAGQEAGEVGATQCQQLLLSCSLGDEAGLGFVGAHLCRSHGSYDSVQ